MDWLVHQRPVEGTRASEPTVAEFARRDVVICRLDDAAGEVRGRIGDSPYPFGLVLSLSGVVLGRIPDSRLDCEPARRVEEVMDPGPKTVRPHKTAAGIAHDLAERDLRWAIVTTPHGELIGVAARAELEAAVGDS